MCQTNQAVVRCSDQNTPLPAQPGSTCIFGTILSTNVTLGKRCVVEYSSVESGVTIGDGSIVSNMMVPSGVSIPPGCFFHTVCVTVDEHDGLFVTVLFSIKDNVKKIMPIEKMNALKYCGQAMDVALKSLAIKQEVNLSASYFRNNKYYLKHEYRGVLSDIKREAQPSVLCLIKHDNECFK